MLMQNYHQSREVICTDMVLKDTWYLKHPAGGLECVKLLVTFCQWAQNF